MGTLKFAVLSPWTLFPVNTGPFTLADLLSLYSCSTGLGTRKEQLQVAEVPWCMPALPWA